VGADDQHLVSSLIISIGRLKLERQAQALTYGDDILAWVIAHLKKATFGPGSRQTIDFREVQDPSKS
jgi:hypothetical protein